jgi:hypothetical protein
MAGLAVPLFNKSYKNIFLSHVRYYYPSILGSRVLTTFWSKVNAPFPEFELRDAHLQSRCSTT